MSQPSKITYYPEATAKCLNCGSSYTLGMTKESLTLEICANCHPFYTGQETLVDTAGRIEKFQARANKGANKPTGAILKPKSRKRRIINPLENIEEVSGIPATTPPPKVRAVETKPKVATVAPLIQASETEASEDVISEPTSKPETK